MTTQTTDPFGMIKEYERQFGKGSWAELERGVKERNPFIFNIIDACEVNLKEQARPLWKKLLRIEP